ncbi:MAG: sugar ABC transporter permease [Lachnospiraceae bacterium]|nr:sugar ABC transporter permease [Lachnospiraceae bacterium]
MKKDKFKGYAKWGYIFCIPFFLAYAIFQLYPTVYTIIIGFTDLKGVTTTTFHFLKNPFENYSFILGNSMFRKAFGNTIKLWVCNFIPQISLALLLTAWFTDRRFKIRGQGFFKVIFYLPNIITAATVAILFSALFGFPMGPVNDILQNLGLIKEPYNFLIKKHASQYIVMFIQTWQWYGYTTVILISGVLGISTEIFEAAEVDGASGWQTFWLITIPNLKTILLFTLVTSLIGGLNMFDIPQLFVFGGGPDNATMTTNIFIYNQAFKGSYQYNKASAASMIMFVIIVVVSAILFYLLRDKDEAALERIKKEASKAKKQRDKEAAKASASAGE